MKRYEIRSHISRIIAQAAPKRDAMSYVRTFKGGAAESRFGNLGGPDGVPG